jgi:hypothetical protein
MNGKRIKKPYISAGLQLTKQYGKQIYKKNPESAPDKYSYPLISVRGVLKNKTR